MSVLAVTAIGKDRPGLVAAVTGVLHERGGNIEDSAMTILGGHFAIVLLVTTDDEPDTLDTLLHERLTSFGLTISVSHAALPATTLASTHLLSVYGADKPGIVATVTKALADNGANIVDLETQIVGQQDEPVYAMVLEFSCTDEPAIAAAIKDACATLGVDHTLRSIATETY
jgi:glycine cleavage system transcriptional repressor